MQDNAFKPPLLPEYFPVKARQTVVPLRTQGQIDGALIIACEADCECTEKDLDLVTLILEQAAGTIKRAVIL